jgi:hypothetical protein
MPLDFFPELPANARVAVTILPFLMALVARLIFGKNRTTGTMLWLATMWLALSVTLVPFSFGILNLHRPF